MVDPTIQTTITLAAQNLVYLSLKEEQREVITNFVQGKDVFAVLPTGFGKSLCYACLPFIFDTIMEGSGYGTALFL